MAKRPPGRKRPPPVIDLDATEVARGPVEPEAPIEAAAEPSPEPPPETIPQPDPAYEPPPEALFRSVPQDPPPEEAASEPSEPSERPKMAWVPPDLAARVPWPLIAAGGVGAGAALVMVLLLWGLGFGPSSQVPNPVPSQVSNQVRADTVSPRLAAIELQLKELAARPAPQAVDAKALGALSDRLAKVESDAARPRSAPAAAATPDLELSNRVASTERMVAALNDTFSSLAAQTTDLAQRAADVAKHTDDLATALTKRTDDIASALRDTRGRIETLSASIAETQSTARQTAVGSDRAVRLAVASSSLRNAVERGEPFGAELAAAKALAKDAAALSTLDPFAASGVPSNAALSNELATLIEPMLKAANAAAPREGGILDKLQANAEKLVRIRKVGEAQAGDDPAAVIARVEARAAQADVAGALTELGKLPLAVRAPAQGWIERAQKRGQAIEASRRFAAGAVAGLDAAP